MALVPNRRKLRSKNEKSVANILYYSASHGPLGPTNTLAEVKAKRPGLHDFEDEVAHLTEPVLLLAGDEDEPCLDVSLWLKRQTSYSALKIHPQAGHLLNLEDPFSFRQDITTFHQLISAGRWEKRPPTPFTLHVFGT